MLDACQPGDDGFLTENIYLGLSAELETAEMTPNAIFMNKIFLGISKFKIFSTAGIFRKNPGIFRKFQKNPHGQKTVETQNFSEV